jgi:signal transduction histidine kinase
LRFLKTISLAVCLLLLSSVAAAQAIQRFNTFTYNVNEGLLQSTIADMEVDKNNFCWISFPNGIQKFDGKNFITVPVQPGLPDDKQCYFFKCSNGDLLISHSQGISKYEITANRFIQVYTNGSGEDSRPQFIGEDNNIIYFYTKTGNITGFECNTFKIVSETKTGFAQYVLESGYTPIFSDNIINHKTAFNINSSLYLWDLKNKKLLYQSAPVPDMFPFLLKLKTEYEVLYSGYKTNNALQLYNFASNTNRTLFVTGKDNNRIYRCIILPWQNKILISFDNRLYETDETWQVLKAELVNFQNQPAAGNASIIGIKEDNFDNLFIQTVTNGIRKIIRNNYPVKYYGTEKKQDNFVLSILPDKKNNRILAGTSGNGLLVFDTLQRLIKHIKILPGRNNPFSPNTILKMSNGNYLLFCGGEKKVWQLSNDLSKLSSIPITTPLPAHKSGIDYFGNFLFQNEREAIIQSQSRLYKTNFAANTVMEHEVTASYTMSGILYNGMIITHANDELIYLDAGTFAAIKKIPFKNTSYVRCFALPSAANTIYVGSNKGIFIIDSTGKVLQHLNKETGLPDECIYAMVFDDDGFLWCSTNKGILKINKDNSILQLTKEDGLQENEFNTNTVAKADDGEIFFGGVNGVSSFYPVAISSFDEKINLFFTQIKANNEPVFKDTAMWTIDKIILPYQNNSLSFDFTAMGSGNPEQYIYQYKMEGIDKEWIQNSGLQTVRYFLPPGDYVFKIYASRFFDKDAKPMKEICIIINPPFWKTWWFLTVLALLFVTGTAISINFYNKRKYKKKLAELESEHKIQLERERISRDLHDSIGAYANAVLYNTELLQKEEDGAERNELMNDLKFASKDIITSLRETIWALKKDEYTAQDCLLRIRNFVQPFSRYYPHINFRVDGEAPEKMKLHYTKALNLVRIVQEALSNAIKHAAAKNISIISSTESEKWKIVVADDGSGFDYASVYALQQGNGLNNIKQRADDSGFELLNESTRQKGTAITVLIPENTYPTGV